MKKLKKIISILLCAAMLIGTVTTVPAHASGGEGKYAYESHPGYQTIIGWEGDRNAAMVYPDGSYWLRSRDLIVNFGVPDVDNINWYNKEGYLPCSVSEFEKDGVHYTIESFGDEMNFVKDVDAGIPRNQRYVMIFSRMTAKNTTGEEKPLPAVSTDLLMPINDAAKNTTTIAAGETVTRDWCIAGDAFDRYGKVYKDWLSNEVMAPLVGTFDEHYEHMKEYWNTRLQSVVDIKTLPTGYEKLIDAYKAGYIYTMIVKDGISLLVGEAEYDDWTFDHDVVGMLATLMELGDYQYLKDYVYWGFDREQYPDARWKWSWPFAIYYQKTGDAQFIKEHWDYTDANGEQMGIRYNTHLIEEDRTGPNGIMKSTNAIDSNGYWLIDNWSALMGLTTYQYLCDELGETEEAAWAAEQYTSLKAAVEAQLSETMAKYEDFSYLPVDMTRPNPLTLRRDPLDANWGAHFMFGRWGWDGYLFGANQDGLMLDLIDDTYTYNFYRQEKANFGPVGLSFGGYPGYSSAYNAGYGSTALRGEEYRDIGIKAYKWMIENTMSGPFSWNECIEGSSDESYWSTPHATSRFGSCPHMWGQSVNTKVLLDSMIAEKSDGTRIIGRGIPNDWIADGETAEIDNVPVAKGNRMGYTISTSGNIVTLNLTGDTSKPVSFELPIFVKNIASVGGGYSYDNEKGAVTVPAGATTVTVTLTNADGYVDPDAAEKKAEREKQIDEFDKAYGDVRSNFGIIPLATENVSVDAQKDSVYDNAAHVKINQLSMDNVVDESAGNMAYGNAYMVWKDGYLYCYAEITDNDVVIPTEEQLASPWDCESLDFYINMKDNDAKQDVMGYRVGVTGYPSVFNCRWIPDRTQVFEYHGYEKTAEMIETASKQTDTGWAVEFRVPMEEPQIGMRVGLQFMINDVYTRMDGGWPINYIRAENPNGGDTWNNYGYAVLGDKPALKGSLKQAIEYANGQKAKPGYENVIPAAKTVFENALSNAEAVYADKNATQAQVDAAVVELIDAVHDLALYKGDKAELLKLIKTADALDLAGFLPAGQEEFKTALTEAKKVFDDENAVQDEVDAAAKALEIAIANLFEKPDKHLLKQAIELAEGLDLTKYVDKGKAELAIELREAKKVYADESATKAQVEEATRALNAAILALRRAANKENLAAVIEKAEALNAADYTPESFADVARALEIANAMMADNTLSEKDQAKVDAAGAVLAAAIENLVKASGSTPGNPDVPDNPDTPDDPKGNNTPTGDTTPLLGLGLLTLFGGAALILCRKKAR